jgi:acetyl esterase/lipase
LRLNNFIHYLLYTMSGLKYDPEFWKVLEPVADALKKPVFDSAIDLRTFSENMFAQRFKDVPRSKDIEQTDLEITSIDGAKIIVHHLLPVAIKDATTPQRAVVYVHGGGLIMGSLESFRPVVEAFTARAAVQFFVVEYRLAPEHRYPAAVEDTYATVKWLQANAQKFNVDPARIALYGASAGGGVAAAAALMARDQGLAPSLARLILLYPMLDDRTTLEPEDPLHEVLTWRVSDNDLGWNAYLGVKDRQQRADDVPIYAAPGRAESLEGLPPTYIDIGGFDLFKHENIAFAAKLAKANNAVEFHLYPGLPHGFEGVAPLITAAKQAGVNRLRVLSDF